MTQEKMRAIRMLSLLKYSRANNTQNIYTLLVLRSAHLSSKFESTADLKFKYMHMERQQNIKREIAM